MKNILLFIVLVNSYLALAKTVYTTPTKLTNETIKFKDDLDLDGLSLVLDRQIVSFKSSRLEGSIRLGSTYYPRKYLLDSVVEFKALIEKTRNCYGDNFMLIEPCMDVLNLEIQQAFSVYKPSFTASDPEAGRDRPALFTAYYSPDFVGSRVKTEQYKWAIYSLPSDATLRSKTREQIDFEGALGAKGKPLFWVDDIFGLYLLHIEGGGRVTVSNEDGSVSSYYLSYAGGNGQKFTFINRYMIAQGMITEPSTVAQREYISTHPEKIREIFVTCPGYIFFQVTEHPPLGVNNIPLTDNRSIATDSRLYAQKGLISYVVTKRPILEANNTLKFVDFSRFFIDQDTGGAIKGKARADIYFGFGKEAEIAANNLKQTGEIYFLIKKMKKPIRPDSRN